MKVVASSSAVFFTNPSVIQCGAINKCALYKSDCSSAYNAGNLLIDSTTGKVTAKQNVADGYTDTVCVKCENTASSSITYGPWKV